MGRKVGMAVKAVCLGMSVREHRQDDNINLKIAKDLQAQQNSGVICSKPFQKVIVYSAFNRIRKGGHGADVEQSVRFLSGLFAWYSFFFFFPLKICEVKEQMSQE